MFTYTYTEWIKTRHVEINPLHSSITPELAINPLGDRIVHTFFRDSANKNDSNSSFANEESAADVISERVNFPDFVRVLAHFRPLKKNVEKNKLNGREEKLRCGCADYFWNLPE